MTAGQPQASMRSVERAFDVIEVLERSDKPLRLSDVARRAGLSPATTLRLLGVLQRRGYVVAEQQAYHLGPATLGAAHGFLVTDGLSRAATPVLQELAATTGLTATLHIRSGLERIVIARVDGADPLRYQLPIGHRLPLHLGAGKVLAAAMPEEELAALIAAVRDLGTAGGRPVSETELRAELALISERGYHYSINERVLGSSGISTPVPRPEGGAIASVSVSGPAERHPESEMLGWVPELRRAAAALGRRRDL
ncbi:IclR family transcriptional regulator, acetate operon repressor [Nonomuraea solani]|uniref:IclR family transcriptional regulator, acetate operon repressor n=1 Tax=Nonomuraea solani TaxID=1144553 RepID=A0A1H6EZG6_9ACTN|nr:IclR family transcriptional regulator [Nonomuraea solani]SEH03287.1 IclR family transcriptional regulator, acetate operon repressor [Nonomuraea solani]